MINLTLQSNAATQRVVLIITYECTQQLPHLLIKKLVHTKRLWSRRQHLFSSNLLLPAHPSSVSSPTRPQRHSRFHPRYSFPFPYACSPSGHRLYCAPWCCISRSQYTCSLPHAKPNTLRISQQFPRYSICC